MSETRTDRLLAERYALGEVLGRGGMGTVWRAHDTLLGRPVAIKELHLPEGAGAESRRAFSERLLREARAAAKLAHPGIVTVYDVVTSADGAPCIVMELVESRTLGDLVRAHGPMPAAMVTSVGLQILDALEAAHRAGIVHRDVKPANILVRPQGQVELTDFGIALAADDERLTTTGMLVGSPGYLAPERISDDVVGPESDLWALGATLFFAAEGRPPFERETTPATLYAIVHDRPQVHVARGPLARAIVALLAPRPADRPTPAQLRAMLTASDAPPPPTAPPMTLVDGPRGPGGTRLTSAPGSGAPGSAGPASAGPGPARRRRGLLVGAAVAALVLLAATFGGGLLVGGSGDTTTDGTVDAGAATATTLTYGPGGTLPEFDLSSPTCGNGRLDPGRTVTYSNSATCDRPHDFELFASADTFLDSEDIPYPGQDQLARYAQGWCGLVFASGQIVGPDKARLAVTALVPDEAAFTQFQPGTTTLRIGRDVHCLLTAADGSQLTGSRRAPA